MAQVVVHEDDGQHRLRYGRRPQSDTRIMTSGGHHLYGISGDVDRVARYLDTRCRFEGRVRDDVLEPLTGQESHMIARAAAADVLVLAPRGDGELEAGSRVRYLLLR